VGTSGFHYRHWRGSFYPEGLPTERWLAFYAERFRTVELNASFYRLPSAKTFERWASLVPDDFRFAVKVSRYLSHVRRLRGPAEPMARLMDRCSRLGDRLGPLLLQLPPDLEAAPERLAAVLERVPEGVRMAVEPRHDSWWSDEVADVLRAHAAALCWADRRGPVSPTWDTADWRYLRYHEGRGRPRPCYRPGELMPWLHLLMQDARRVTDAWVYFNNDAMGCAISDATELIDQAREAGLEVG
jgi:uncharacterized protein YecE (DUF72 family)